MTSNGVPPRSDINITPIIDVERIGIITGQRAPRTGAPREEAR